MNQKGARQSDPRKTKSIAHYKQDLSRPASAELEEHAAKLRRWLMAPKSKLRMFIAAMSSGGLYYVAQCHDKCGRGFVEYDGGSLAAFKAAAVSNSSSGLSGCSDDSLGLIA